MSAFCDGECEYRRPFRRLLLPTLSNKSFNPEPQATAVRLGKQSYFSLNVTDCVSRFLVHGFCQYVRLSLLNRKPSSVGSWLRYCPDAGREQLRQLTTIASANCWTNILIFAPNFFAKILPWQIFFSASFVPFGDLDKTLSALANASWDAQLCSTPKRILRGQAPNGWARIRLSIRAAHRFNQFTIVRVTVSEASCCTKCSASGTVTRVKSFSSHFQVSFNAPASNALSLRP